MSYNYSEDQVLLQQGFSVPTRREQDEQSFKAGRREVVDWVENNHSYSDRLDTISMENREWSDQLKEWKIK